MASEPDGGDRLRPPAGPASPPDGPPRGQPAPPPRPGLSYSSPAPIVVVPPAPRSVRLARNLWLWSFVSGLAVLAGSFLTRDSNLERLRTVVQELAPGGDEDAVGTATVIVFWGSIGAVLLVVLLEAAMLGVVVGRQGWARLALILLLAAHVTVMVVAATFLVPPGDAGSYVAILWGLEILLAFIGLVFLFFPSASAWLRSGR